MTLWSKDCAIHGHFEDVMSIDTDFSRHPEGPMLDNAITIKPRRQMHEIFAGGKNVKMESTAHLSVA